MLQTTISFNLGQSKTSYNHSASNIFNKFVKDLQLWQNIILFGFSC